MDGNGNQNQSQHPIARSRLFAPHHRDRVLQSSRKYAERCNCSVRSRAEVARLQVRAQVRRVKRFAARAYDEFGRVPAARLRPDIRVEPGEHRREIARGDARVDVRHRAPDGRKPLRRVHRAQRVAREITERALAPVHVLQAAVLEIAARVESSSSRIFSSHSAGMSSASILPSISARSIS